jgi:ATPase family associated with various cellular activities (AAA)
MGGDAVGAPGARGAAELLELTVALGLGGYAGRIDDAEPALRLARQDAEAAARETGLEGLEWSEQRTVLARAWDRTDGPLRRLTGQLLLGPADLFLVGLAAACERRRTVSLAIAALQAPLPASRPSVHLALDMLETLFGSGAGDAIALASGPLIEAGLLSLEGQDALPQRVLAIRLPLWRALSGGPSSWPGGKIIAPVAAGTDGLPTAALERAADAIAAGEAGGIVIRGPPGSGRAAIAAAVAQRLGLAAIEVPLAVFLEDRGFASACRTVGWMPVLRLGTELGEVAVLDTPGGTLPVCVLAGTHGAVEGDRLIELPTAPPEAAERLRLWRAALGERWHGMDATTLTSAVLYPKTIGAVARSARIRAETEDRAVTQADVAEARRALAPDALGRVAHPVTRSVSADALVATPELANDLAALIGRCRRRETIWNGLGPTLVASTTRGVRALFAGESGTGKTLAASYVATALAAPLYRCDLAAVMNKYIGESEKNLGALLDHAEAADVVLLFDEADALFGRRSEGSETGERYANMLTNYLLTRLEAHHGIVILTTNSKARIDPAFWRRLDQVIDFPAPGYAERLALWKSHLGVRAPSEEVLERLAAYCDLSGGGVRNAVLAAAAMAPADGPIGLEDLTPGLQREYAKLRRTLPAGLALAMRAAQ